ncbi:hypothetical protein B0T26DRAFT_194171 [Lasiosphaeria miniovina]|uniref:Uncharacterized protein n=1 Tax=Lasiosphaeria miniovina TaxID=1954250 RepID=A0AA40ATX0_9PEZI|nr:uncharacterized protein B0T26DRAFT_194171 [Lasiosphaeria miniovina]KAK0721857.1 hypothetical protein B0T26DRAFT_194171 [Lasiosphaeria miniovina]
MYQTTLADTVGNGSQARVLRAGKFNLFGRGHQARNRTFSHSLKYLDVHVGQTYVVEVCIRLCINIRQLLLKTQLTHQRRNSTSKHVRTFAPSHFHTFTPSHLHTFTPSHLHTFTSSHLHIFSTTCRSRCLPYHTRQHVTPPIPRNMSTVDPLLAQLRRPTEVSSLYEDVSWALIQGGGFGELEDAGCGEKSLSHCLGYRWRSPRELV